VQCECQLDGDGLLNEIAFCTPGLSTLKVKYLAYVNCHNISVLRNLLARALVKSFGIKNVIKFFQVR
jgi:hypothetical protein